METQCPKCEGTVKTIPAGTSKKTGKPYDAFQVCENKDRCGWVTPRQFTKGAAGKSSGYVAQTYDRSNQIKQAQDRKEISIARFNSLNAAINLVCHHQYYLHIAAEDEVLKTIYRLQKEFYDHNMSMKDTKELGF